MYIRRRIQILEAFELKFRYIKQKKFLLSIRQEEIIFNIWDIL